MSEVTCFHLSAMTAVNAVFPLTCLFSSEFSGVAGNKGVKEGAPILVC